MAMTDQNIPLVNRLKATDLLKLYGVGLLAFLALDVPWLQIMSPAVYRVELGHLMADSPNLLAAFGFYALYIAGCLYLVVIPSASIKEAATRGGVLGLIAYGTYDMTGLAVFKDWPAYLSFLDMIWGTFLTASVCSVSRWFMKRLLPA